MNFLYLVTDMGVNGDELLVPGNRHGSQWFFTLYKIRQKESVTCRLKGGL